MTDASSRWRIEQVRTDAHDHFYCADYEWRVIDETTGAVVACFSESYGAGDASGAARVSISEDAKEIVVTYHDESIVRYPLEKTSP